MPVDYGDSMTLQGCSPSGGRESLVLHQISSAVSTALREHNERLAMLVVRSAVGTAICSKPLARWMYGDWIPPAES